MKKSVLIVSMIILLIGCISKPFTTNGYEEVNSKVKVYFDNMSSEDITASVLLDKITSFGGITLEKNTTNSFIEVDFSDRDEGEGNLGIEIMTSDSAIQYIPVTPFEISKLNGERRYSMKYPNNQIIITNNSQNTSSSIEIEVKHK